MHDLSKILSVVLGVSAVSACSTGNVLFGSGGAGSTGTASTTGSATTVGSSSSGHTGSSSSGQVTSSSSSSGQVTSSSSSSGSGICVITDPNADMDHDGWTPAQGDCNDCDPNVNPGAFDVPGEMVDHDCNGKYDPPAPCDTGLALDDVDPIDAAKAIELCRVTTASPALPQKTWGVLSSQYVRASGAAFATPGLQVGIQSGFGTGVNPQGGQNMLAISSGYARTVAQTGACGSASCTSNASGTPPPGFPQNIPTCPPSPSINDDVGLQVDLRTPTNAVGYAFSLKFYSMEFPHWVCDAFNMDFALR